MSATATIPGGESVACPQLEDGFAMIASELVAAIFIADFPKYEKVILADVILGQYGPDKEPEVLVDVIRLGEMIGADPRCLRRGLRNLVRKGVLIRHGEHSFSFVKDWESWIDESVSDDPADPLGHLVRPRERRFIAYSAARFSAKIRSTHKRKAGAIQPPKGPLSGAIQPPYTRPLGAIQPPYTRRSGANQPPTIPDASPANPVKGNDLQISSSQTPVPPDPHERRRLDRGGLSTAPPDISREGGGSAPLDELRDQVALLTGDDNLAAVFRDHLVDWMTCGMTPADVREALLIAQGKSVDPRSFVPFVSSTARRVRNDRLAAERRAREAPSPPAVPAPAPEDPETSRRKFKEGLRELRARGGRPHAG